MVNQQFTTFIGRTQELAEIAALLADPACHLLTLVGPGGIGKTRLALEVTQTLDFPNGVHFVPLQPLKSPDQITFAIINALHLRPDEGVGPKQALLDYLCDANLLLVLDNFEHLLVAADLIAEILSVASQVTVLVTSREPLNLREEWVREVGGLKYPVNGEISKHSNYSALLLFAERARRLKAGFSLDNEYEHVVRICSVVEGLPLALELAAGWLRTLSCKAIASEIQYNLDMLATNMRDVPERHQSMRVVFDHSWRLLNENEQTAIRYFSVFRGGCTREAAEQIAGASLPVLASLVEKSLLRHDSNTDRYDMQELLRQYANEQLIMAGELEKAREAHHAYYAQFLQNLAQNVSTSDETWHSVRADFDNIRAAWMWAVEHRHYATIENLTDPIWDYAASDARCFEALDLYEAARAMLASEARDSQRYLRGQMISYLGMCHGAILHWETSETLTQEALVITREQGDPTQIGQVTSWLSVVFWHQGKYSEAIQLSSDFVDAYREECHPVLLAILLMRLGNFHGGIGHIEVRQQFYQESLNLIRAIGDLDVLGDLYRSMGQSAIYNGQWHQAEIYLADCHKAYLDSHNVKGINWQQTSFAQLMVANGQIEVAQQTAEATFLKAQKNELLAFVANSALTLACLSLLADARGNYDTAHQQANDALRYAQRYGDLFVLMPVKFVMGWSLISLEKDDLALNYLVDFLQTALLWKANGCLLYAVGGLARILTHQGAHVRVTELLGLIFTHPNSPIGYFENYPPFEHLQATLKVELGTEVFASAWERGTRLDVEQVGYELLRTLTAKVNNAAQQANQKPVDALTPRELEVLRLLAAGLSNPQIANQLTITVGTAKTHVHNIYAKLNVKTRAQAILRIHKLKLI